MTKVQKITKYLAIAFALFLIISIITAILNILNIFNIKDGENDFDFNPNLSSSYLCIDVRSADLIIKSGDKLKVETDNKNIIIEQDNNKIIIKEKKHFSLSNVFSSLIITIPNTLIFDNVLIETGAGSIDIDFLNTKVLDLDLGAGKFIANNLNVYNKAEIEGGAGKINIKNGNINNLNLELGVGETYIKSSIIGISKIECGIGKFKLDLIGLFEDYKFNVETGIGSIKINNETVKDKNIGNGINTIDIEGGIGSIQINTGLS